MPKNKLPSLYANICSAIPTAAIRLSAILNRANHFIVYRLLACSRLMIGNQSLTLVSVVIRWKIPYNKQPSDALIRNNISCESELNVWFCTILPSIKSKLGWGPFTHWSGLLTKHTEIDRIPSSCERLFLSVFYCAVPSPCFPAGD